MGQQWKCFCIICWYRKSPEKNRVRGQCDGVGGWYSTNDRPLQQWTCLRESRKLSRSIWVWQNKKIAGSRRQVTGTIQTINQYSFTKLMVMVGMSIIVLVRRRKAGWRGPTLFHLLDGKFLWNRRRSNLKHHHWRNGTKLWQRDHHIERKTSWEGSRGPGSLQKAEHDLARTSCVQAIQWTLFVRWLGLVITGLLVQSWEALGN